MRRCHISIIACSSPDDPKSGGLGNSLSRYRQIAIDSAMQVPSSSSRRGIRPKEFFAKYSLFLFSPEIGDGQMDKHALPHLFTALVATKERRKLGSAACMICGLTAIKTTAGAAGKPTLSCTPSDLTQSLGAGSLIQIDPTGTPASIQPFNSADPILPQPSSSNPCSEITRICFAPDKPWLEWG